MLGLPRWWVGWGMRMHRLVWEERGNPSAETVFVMDGG